MYHGANLEKICKLLPYLQFSTLRPSRGIISLFRLKFSFFLLRNSWYLERGFFIPGILFLYVSVMVFYLAKQEGVQNNRFAHFLSKIKYLIFFFHPRYLHIYSKLNLWFIFFTPVTCIYTSYIYSFMHIFISIEVYYISFIGYLNISEWISNCC